MARPAPGTPPLPRDFRRLLVSWFFSLTSDGLRMIALPLLANALAPGAAGVATVAAFTALPWLLVAVPAGALVDRWDPARVVITAHVVRAVVTLSLVAAIGVHWVGLPILCAFGFLLTSAETFADGAAQTLLVEMVDPAHLERANSRFVTVETIGLDLLGALGGGIAFVIANWLPFVLSAAGFVLSACLMSGLPGKISRKLPSQRRESVFAQVRSGLTELFTDRVLRTLVLTVGVIAAAFAAQDAVLVVYATTNLHMSAQWYPTLLIALSAGVLVAAAVVGRLQRRLPSGRLMVVVAIATALSLMLMGALPSAPIALGCYALLGVSSGIWNVLSASRRQRRTPPRMVARVSSAFRVIAWGAMPIGAALGGVVGHAYGVRQVFILSGVVVLLVVLVAARSFLTAEPEDLRA